MRSSRPKIRVFVIEDHVATARALKMFLEATGFAVHVATDIKSALELAPNIAFDVVLCDLNLPDGTGWDLLGRLKKRYPKVAAIAFSAFDEPQQVAQSRAVGFLNHLVKGAPAEELVAALQSAAAGNKTAVPNGRSKVVALRPKKERTAVRRSGCR